MDCLSTMNQGLGNVQQIEDAIIIWHFITKNNEKYYYSIHISLGCSINTRPPEDYRIMYL